MKLSHCIGISKKTCHWDRDFVLRVLHFQYYLLYMYFQKLRTNILNPITKKTVVLSYTLQN